LTPSQSSEDTENQLAAMGNWLDIGQPRHERLFF
jgi:hypothetical protein